MTKKRKAPLRYFFLNGLLHKKLLINRSADQIITWCYPQHKRVTYTYSDVLKRKEPAFTTPEVCAMINRKRTQVEMALVHGQFPSPQYTYGIDENKRKYKYMWSEQDIMNIHDYFLTVHRGRPRADGKIVPQYMPTKRELRAMIRQEEVLYIKGEDGEFRPVWKSADFT